MSSRTVTETSVTLSLADLARIEEERVRIEDVERAKAREKKLRDEREREAARRTREATEAAATIEAQSRQAREAALERARVDAQERALADVRRIEADAKAKLEIENAARAHELALLRTRRETGRRRREVVMGVFLALTFLGGGALVNEFGTRVKKSELAAEQLREGQRAFARERDDAKRTQLSALDRRHAALIARPGARAADDAKSTADTARDSVDERAIDHSRLHAFADALDGLQARIDRVEKLATLEKRHADLSAWAASVRRSDAGSAAQKAAREAKAPTAGAGALITYERSLDELRDTLARPSGARGSTRRTETGPGPGTCAAGDPGCGLDGRSIF